MAKHGKHKHDQRQWQAPPKAPLEIDQFRALGVVEARHFRFQRHAAFRAISWFGLPDFRMHWTSKDRPFRTWCGGFHWIQIFLRVGPEFCHAAGTAKVIVGASVCHGLFRIGADLHATYQVGEWFVLIAGGYQDLLLARLLGPVLGLHVARVHSFVPEDRRPPGQAARRCVQAGIYTSARRLSDWYPEPLTSL